MIVVQSGERPAEPAGLRREYVADAVQTRFFGLLGLDPADLAPTMADNEALIETSGVDLDSYEAPGERHTVFQHDEFYTEQVDGVPLTDWVAALIAGDDVDDVG